jgi:threonine dehydrogenase-like Zn-dependent dehydrogenase
MSNNPNLNDIDALQFEMKLRKLAWAYLRGQVSKNSYWKRGGPVKIKKAPFPKLIDEQWVIIKTRYCGICGSDLKEITLNGKIDNPIRSFVSFPQIMGHEAVGTVYKIGTKVSSIKVGDRVAISPWFPCKSRGISNECFRCKMGDYVHCKNFESGALPVGMHMGVTRGYGGFTSHFAVHESQCFKIPDKVEFDQAVLADPFSVAFHSILLLNPKPDSKVLIFGLGVIGLSVIICLKKIFNVKEVLAIGRYAFQKEFAEKLGASNVFMKTGDDLIKEIAEHLNIELYTPEKGSPWAIQGVDGIIDTIGSGKSLEIGIRILEARKTLVFLGVSNPMRFENTPHYFKELEIVGSNAFSMERFNNLEAHAFEFFLKFLANQEIDLSGFITHKFPLIKYKQAFEIASNKSKSKAIKVLFEFP